MWLLGSVRLHMGLSLYFYGVEVLQIFTNIGSLWFCTIVLVPDVDSYLSLGRESLHKDCGFPDGHPTQFLLVMQVQIMWQVPGFQRNDQNNGAGSSENFWCYLLHKSWACMFKS